MCGRSEGPGPGRVHAGASKRRAPGHLPAAPPAPLASCPRPRPLNLGARPGAKAGQPSGSSSKHDTRRQGPGTFLSQDAEIQRLPSALPTSARTCPRQAGGAPRARGRGTRGEGPWPRERDAVLGPSNRKQPAPPGASPAQVPGARSFLDVYLTHQSVSPNRTGSGDEEDIRSLSIK